MAPGLEGIVSIGGTGVSSWMMHGIAFLPRACYFCKSENCHCESFKASIFFGIICKPTDSLTVAKNTEVLYRLNKSIHFVEVLYSCTY